MQTKRVEPWNSSFAPWFAPQRKPRTWASDMSYLRFAAMIVTSTVVMYGLMYLNVDRVDHVYWSTTRLYMALIMGATMALIMLGFMWGMYESTRANIGIVLGSVAGFALALLFVRSQTMVGDTAWMRAMIPHHSIAILTSERANLSNPRVRKLADEIIAAQRREIEEMKTLLNELAAGQRTGRVTRGAEVAEITR